MLNKNSFDIAPQNKGCTDFVQRQQATLIQTIYYVIINKVLSSKLLCQPKSYNINLCIDKG